MEHLTFYKSASQIYITSNDTDKIVLEKFKKFIFKKVEFTKSHNKRFYISSYEGWKFNSGNYLFTTDTK